MAKLKAMSVWYARSKKDIEWEMGTLSPNKSKGSDIVTSFSVMTARGKDLAWDKVFCIMPTRTEVSADEFVFLTEAAKMGFAVYTMAWNAKLPLVKIVV